MNISPTDLDAEYVRARAQWPVIDSTNAGYALPYQLLYAVGSRETNLTNEVGDGGHGHGVWQLDDRSHVIPAGFDENVTQQCTTAAAMLANLIRYYRTEHPAPNPIRAALAAYNAGQGTVDGNLAAGADVDLGTAGDDYSADTYARMIYLQQTYPQTHDAPEAPAMMPELIQFTGQGPSAGLHNLDAVYVHIGRVHCRWVSNQGEEADLLALYGQKQVTRTNHSRGYYGVLIGIDPETMRPAVWQ